MNSAPSTFNSLDDIMRRKQELLVQMERDNDQISHLWHGLFLKREESSRGEFIANVISNGALAIDALLMLRKLKKTHNTLFRLFKKKKKK